MRHFDPSAVSKKAVDTLKTKKYRTGLFEFWRACDISGSDHAIDVLLNGKTNLRESTAKLLFSMLDSGKKSEVAEKIKKECGSQRPRVCFAAHGVLEEQKIEEKIMHPYAKMMRA